MEVIAVEMSQIRYVLAAAKTLNFTKAAVNCNVSQPALTKAIKTLEAQLGAPLFHREGKRVLLSDFGRSMLPHLQHIMAEAEAAKTLADNFKLLNDVPVRIGVMSTVGHVRLSRFLAKYQKDYEGVEVAVSEARAFPV
jgi:DNA-binding transcriptional LysR family regulator